MNQAQSKEYLSAVYSCELKSSYFEECNIVFFKTGEYYIFVNLKRTVADNLVYFPLSFGKYFRENDTMFLIDKICRYKLIYLIKERNMFPIKTYEFLGTRKFELTSLQTSEYQLDLTDCKANALLLNKQLNHISNYNLTNEEIEGYYESNYSFRLEICANKTYKLSNHDLTFSSGIWHNKGNSVLLKDICLNTTFELSVKKIVEMNNKKIYLQSNFILFDFYGLRFIHL